MKKIIGLDLGVSSIGWALVEEAEQENEKSSIIKLGVRVNPLTVDEQRNFEQGKSITTNADRTLKRSMRRNLQRYKLRREFLIKMLREVGFISNDTILSEHGNRTTFETYRLRAKAVTEEVSLSEFTRILLMINKKRGYKSTRKVMSSDEGQLIDGMEIAKLLYNKNLTPGQYTLEQLRLGKKRIPDFYRSDLQMEFDKIWKFQSSFHPEILTDDFKSSIENKGKVNTLQVFKEKYGIFSAENKGKDKQQQSYIWRTSALVRELTLEELAYVIGDLNGQITNSSGYLGSISDRSKDLYFNKQTVGQYLMQQLESNPNTSLRNKVFYRQDYLDEFERIWETQMKFHPELTPELKREIRDVIIFYQRPLKSQKGLISFCEFEKREVNVEIEGKKKKKTVGLRVIPKSSPLFQEFKIWQVLNNLKVSGRFLELEEKELLYKELSYKDKLKEADVLKIIDKNNYKNLKLNFKEVEGNRTQTALYKAYQAIIAASGHGEYDFNKMNAEEITSLVFRIFKGLNIHTDILKFDSGLQGKDMEQQPMFRLWHLLYSFEGDDSPTGNEKLIKKLMELYGFNREYASILANVNFQTDYGSLSSKATSKILPFMKAGHEYSLACEYAGYRHSASSLTKEEIAGKVLKDRLEVLPKNSLRNPVVEKILNQFVNVVNNIIDVYGKPDEIRIELARELKKNSKQREKLTQSINKAKLEHEKYKEILQSRFGFSHVSKNDILRYKLYLELAPRGFHTLYSNTYIPEEKLFDGEFDIDHIIPQARLFDDSFSNKTLELRSVNIDKGNTTAYDYIINKYHDDQDYLSRIAYLDKDGSRAKYLKLKMAIKDIPTDFINRDLQDTQYIAKKAKMMLEELVPTVVSTTGAVTARLREDWQLVDLMQELNWEKYDCLGFTEVFENKDGKKVKRIKNWTKRNDHRHHAMDALAIAFTKQSYIQYLNSLNAKYDENDEQKADICEIEKKELGRVHHSKFKFKAPIMPVSKFRFEAKKQFESLLVSIKSKNKVVTRNINKTKTKDGVRSTIQLTPRGQLHLETVYGSMYKYVSKEVKVGASFTNEIIAKVARKDYREALEKRLEANNNDPKKAFTGKNSLDKNPIYLNDLHDVQVPEKVKIVTLETVYTIRKEISPDLKIDKVINPKIRSILKQRLSQYDGDEKRAFTNLNENPIWLNEEKGISIKRVTISGINNGQALRVKRDKDGKPIIGADGRMQPVDFVNTGNNHHVAIFSDQKGDLQEQIVSFFEATERVNQGLPIIDKTYKIEEGWKFLFSMKQNEYFVFPNENNQFDPKEIDLLDPENYSLISSNMYRVQKLATKDYFFRHHLETSVDDNNSLKGITWKRVGLSGIKDIIKIRVNHIGEIVHVGEY